MIHESRVSCISNTPLVYLRRLFDRPEPHSIARPARLNSAGSVKDRPARFILEQVLADESVPAGTRAEHRALIWRPPAWLIRRSPRPTFGFCSSAVPALGWSRNETSTGGIC